MVKVWLGFGKWVKVLSQCEAFSFETVSFLVLKQVVNVITKSKCNKTCFFLFFFFF